MDNRMTLEEAQARLQELQDNKKRFAELLMASYQESCKSMKSVTSWRLALISDGMLYMVDEVDRIFDTDIKVVQDMIDSLQEPVSG